MKNVVLVGGGKIGIAITEFLSSTGDYRVTVIDRDVQSLERVSNFTATEAVIAVLPLLVDRNQRLALKPVQVHACGRWAHFSDNRQLCAGAGMAIEQCMQHADTRGLANSGGDSRNHQVCVHRHSRRCNHSLMVNEVLLVRKRYR